MTQCSLPLGTQSLFEQVCYPNTLIDAFLEVRKNKGSHGSDNITIQQFENNLEKELLQLIDELQSWTYKPKPVRRVEIPKPDNKGVRILGVPCVRDRVVQTAIKNGLGTRT